MRNNQIFKKIQAKTAAYSIQELRALTYTDLVTKFGLTKKEAKMMGPYHSNIIKGLIGILGDEQRKQMKNEMVNKFLLSGSNITNEEAQIAVEVIFEERSK